MPQGVLSYKYEQEKQASGMTPSPVSRLPRPRLGPRPGDHIRTHLQVKVRGWTDEQMVLRLSCSTSPGETAWMTSGYWKR